VPVRQVLHTDPYEIVKPGFRTTGGTAHYRPRPLAGGANCRIGAVLVTTSLVAARGLVRTFNSNSGFEPRNAILVNTDLNMAGYRNDAVAAVQRPMIEATGAIRRYIGGID